MPAQLTSADKKLHAQQARRQAALNSANNRRGRKRASTAAVPVENSTVESNSILTDTVSSAPDKGQESLFNSPDVAKSDSVSEAISASINNNDDSDCGSKELDILCEIAESNPNVLGSDLNNVRQICRNRRKAMSSRGKAAVPSKNSASSRRGGNAARAMAYAAGQINSRDLAKLRRKDMAFKGRGDAPRSRPSGRVRPTWEAPKVEPPKVKTSTTLSGSEAVTAIFSKDDSDGGNEQVDILCEIADSNPTALGSDLSNVRQICRNRRKAMSTRGKAAVPGKNTASRSSGGNSARAMAYAAKQINSRDLAKLRRQDMANKGRGDAPKSRPSGRVRPNLAPPKVETGTTLSGQEVSGTQVERTNSVTGNEPGTCRAITGTEYVGSEQFADFCGGTQPEANTPKVGLSFTDAGEPLTGTEVGRSEKVTGDEQGACVSVTGSEYVNSEMLANFCGTQPQSSQASANPATVMSNRSAPPKVESGTTLSGQEVLGTQVERTNSVTGNEPGTCQSITGTEYVGSEQFTSFCGTQPEANVPKVGVSLTGAGEPVTGTEVGRSNNVTGDEQGTCASVTGSEYVGAEKLANFCGTQPSAKPAKVMSSRTEQADIRVTGADGARSNATTGTEAGTQQRISGSQYSDLGAAKMTINGPSKVALTHTIAGQPVTGTEVGKSATVTGDDYGSCRPVTGTEYISNEQFQTVCGTIPEPHPAKVGVDNSMRGQRITGALVNRTENVTGNESGSCSQLTGTQYSESKLCGGAPPKVNDMHTLSGNNLTGNSVDLSPKMTGDEQGGCLPVTGIEYYGQEQFAQCSTSAPKAAPAKVGVDHTPKGEHVSGTMVGAVGNVTGNEHGAQLSVSGTPYTGVQVPHDHGSCCDACAVRDAAAAAGLIAEAEVKPCDSQSSQQQAQPVTAPVPAQQTPVQAQTQYPVQPAVPPVQQAVPEDFSIVSPARAAQITGSHSSSNYSGGRVTGPGDLARNYVSGTPEFRYPETRQVAAPAPQPQMAAYAPQAAMAAPAPQPVMAAPAPQPVMAAPAPQPVMAAPAPQPVMAAPAPQPVMAAPAPQPVMAAPAPQPVMAAPAPQPVMAAPAPQPQMAAYAPQAAMAAPAPAPQPQMAAYAPQAAMAEPAPQPEPTPEPVFAPVEQQPQEAESVATSSQRITGEGREDGIPVSGDNWSRTVGVTGTEGHVAKGRNPSLRGGEAQQPVKNAHYNKELERPDVPAAQVTGSSGNSNEGAVITVSGGARG